MAKQLGLAALTVPFVILLSTGCDVNPSPTSTTTVNNVPAISTRLNGSFTSRNLSSQGRGGFSQTDLDEITVEVQNTDIQTGVSSNGAFSLTGLPVGSFTLLFRNEVGEILGEFTFTNVVDGQTISLVLSLEDDTVTLEEERRDGVVVSGTIDGDDESSDDESSDDESQDDASSDDTSSDDASSDDESGGDDSSSGS